MTQAPELPAGQDVIRKIDDAPSLLEWAGGSLPVFDLEMAAADLFSETRPRILWNEPEMREACDDARASVLRLYVRFLRMSKSSDWQMPERSELSEIDDPRWRDAYFSTQLAMVTAQYVYGADLHRLRPSLRADIRSYAESYAEDAADRYAKILNAAETGPR